MSRSSSFASVVTFVVACGAAAPSVVAAQAPAPTAPRQAPATPSAPAIRPRQPATAVREGEVQSDPIRCWWKTDRTAVRVGERFTLVLTCGVIETAGITVVPAVNQLEAGALSLTPFEAVSGVRREDVVTPPWRYLQFEYTMRLLAEGFFGQDIEIPALTVTYNLLAPGGGAEGRDQTYLLPAMPMRVLSLVPRAAADIRDASGQTFAGVESRRFRASTAMVVAIILFAFAALVVVFAIARAAGRFRARTATAVRPMSAPSLLGASLRALAGVRSEAGRDGWTPELAARAVAALRVAGAVALGRSVTQEFVDADALERPGQLTIRTGLLRPKRALLSAPTTPAVILSRLEKGKSPGAQARVTLQQLAEALQVFGAVSYGRASELDSSALTNALDTAVAAIRRLRLSARLPLAGLRGSFSGASSSSAIRPATVDRS